MPKYLWRPYRNAVKNLRYYEETESRLIEVSGFDMDKLIELFAAGHVLKKPNYETQLMQDMDLKEEDN